MAYPDAAAGAEQYLLDTHEFRRCDILPGRTERDPHFCRTWRVWLRSGQTAIVWLPGAFGAPKGDVEVGWPVAGGA
jgi:hypothetical protein